MLLFLYVDYLGKSDGSAFRKQSWKLLASVVSEQI